MKTPQYTWNKAPIYDKDVSCCISDVVKELKFSLGVEIGAAPTLNDDNQSILFQYPLNKFQ